MTQDHPHNKEAVTAIHFRPGTIDDLEAVHRMFQASVADLVWRLGIHDGDRMPSEAERIEDLQRWRPLLEYLTESADQYWIAEQNGEVLGYARSVLRDNVRELTEFFVSPNAQSDGIGRELLARALPPGASRTFIMATLDLRAQALYHKFGTYQSCAVYSFYKKRKHLMPAPPVEPATDAAAEGSDRDPLTIVPITAEDIPRLARLDKAIHGHTRDQDHAWFMTQRTGFLLLHGDRAVGYGYAGNPFSGPFVMLNTADFPVALAYAEEIAMTQGFDSFGVDVPMLNRTAIKYLLERGYKMSPFFCFYMSDQQPLHPEKTIITGPMIMV